MHEFKPEEEVEETPCPQIQIGPKCPFDNTGVDGSFVNIPYPQKGGWDGSLQCMNDCCCPCKNAGYIDTPGGAGSCKSNTIETSGCSEGWGFRSCDGPAPIKTKEELEDPTKTWICFGEGQGGIDYAQDIGDHKYQVQQVCGPNRDGAGAVGNPGMYQCQQGLNQEAVADFCRSNRYNEIAFGHSLQGQMASSNSMGCGECYEIRSKRQDGTYNVLKYMALDGSNDGNPKLGQDRVCQFADNTGSWIGDSPIPFDWRRVPCTDRFDNAYNGEWGP